MNRLACLEAVHGVGYKDATPEQISDLIFHVIEEPSKYKMESVVDWFIDTLQDDEKSVVVVENLLRENNHKVRRSVITEGITEFRKEYEE